MRRKQGITHRPFLARSRPAMADFGSPIAPTTPSKAPASLQRASKVRRRLQMSASKLAASTFVSATSVSTQANPTTDDSTTFTGIKEGSVVTVKAGARADRHDKGMVFQQTEDKFSVIWRSDGAKTTHSSDELALIESPRPPPASSSSTTANISPDRIKHKDLITTSVPESLKCPLHSQDTVEIQTFQLLMDNVLFSGHPNVKKVILGHLDNPLQYCQEFIELMALKESPDPFIFDPRKSEYYLSVVAVAKPNLLPTLEMILDNGKYNDGYRPANAAIYSKLMQSLHKTDLWALRQVERGDGVGLRNILWRKMQGGSKTQRRLQSLKTPLTVSDINYKFEFHGVDKYFAKIHTKLGSFKLIDRSMDPTTTLTEIFQHMEKQCLEYKETIDKQRTKFVASEQNVTLASLQIALETVETANGLGVTSKGTPIPQIIPMNPVPPTKSIPANSVSFAGSKNAPAPKSGPSKKVDERNAKQNYGAPGSHTRGACKYPKHHDDTDHCWQGCSKCGGCFFYHKRKRLTEEGRTPCDHPKHLYAVHLRSECSLIKKEQREKSSNNNSNRNNHDRNNQRNKRGRTRSRDRGPTRNRSPDQRRDHRHDRDRGRNHSRGSGRRGESTYESRNFRANMAQPIYFQRVEGFARSRSRSRDRRRRKRSRSTSRSRSRSRHDRRDNAIPAFRAFVSRHHPRSEGRQAGRYTPGLNDDGLSDTWLEPILRESYQENTQPHKQTHPRRLVIGAANAGVKRTEKKTVLDSGAGRPIFDDDSFYEPSSRSKIAADVVWGDGSNHPVKYEGTIGPLSGCVNTGGASDANLLSVGSAIDSLQHKYKRKISIMFDDASAYLFKDVAVQPHPRKRGRFKISDPASSSGMLTATREPGSEGVYVVPMNDPDPTPEPRKHFHAMAANSNSPQPAKNIHPSILSKSEKDAAVPKRSKSATILEDNVQLPSRSSTNISRDLQRMHNCYSHAGAKVLRQMLLLSGTQKHKRLARKVHDLQPQCNCCLEGHSQAQSHAGDPLQPTSRATRPLERVCSDSTGTNNIPTLGGAIIAFVIICQFSRYCWLWMLKSTKQATAVVRKWLQTTIKQQHRLKTDPDSAILYWRSDNGPEFPAKFTSMLSKYAIEHERTGSKASQQNADSESYLNSLQKRCRTSLAWARAPRPWYGEAYCHMSVSLNHTCRLKNPNCEAPITTLYGRRPDLHKLKPFGCLAFINIPKKSRVGAVNRSAHHGVMMGYVTGSDGRILA